MTAAEATETQAASTGSGSTKPRVTAEKVFDRTKQIRNHVPHPDFPDGKKICIVRFPTDKEWCLRAHRTVNVRKSSADGGVRADSTGLVGANKELFDTIRIHEGNSADVEFDEAEASRIIERLERCVVQEVTKKGVEYTITMKPFDGSLVTHVLKIPTQKLLMDYGKAAVDIVGRKQAVETRVALEPSADLWKKLQVSSAGYLLETLDVMENISKPIPDPIPVIHMDAAINALLTALREDFDDTDPED